jgi:hypothetical protein
LPHHLLRSNQAQLSACSNADIRLSEFVRRLLRRSPTGFQPGSFSVVRRASEAVIVTSPCRLAVSDRVLQIAKDKLCHHEETSAQIDQFLKPTGKGRRPTFRRPGNADINGMSMGCKQMSQSVNGVKLIPGRAEAKTNKQD